MRKLLTAMQSRIQTNQDMVKLNSPLPDSHQLAHKMVCNKSSQKKNFWAT